jgi:hypothetical protein
MGIQQAEDVMYWNYFLSIEDDIVELARWIEFHKDNYECYSIEMARLLMTCSAEVDVLAKLLCKDFFGEPTAESINAYQETFFNNFPAILNSQIEIPRYGLTLKPWHNWRKPKNPPLWWSANNKVKHHRSEYFKQASLGNVLNAAAGLFYLLLIYYGKVFGSIPSNPKLFTSNMIFGTPENAKMIILPNTEG